MGSWLLQMTKPAGHPNAGLLRDFASRRLRGEIRMTVADHLGSCPECQKLCTEMVLHLQPEQERSQAA